VAGSVACKTALITGAGRDIGRAIALGLADAAAGLILVARSAGQLAETRVSTTPGIWQFMLFGGDITG